MPQCGPATLADVVKLSVEELAFLTGSAEIDGGIAQLAQRFPARPIVAGDAG